ncbi:MAG TPA: nuclease-related domain-containing protein, partial [Ktedonobacterales bacterium]|nr:nuclease-related domain-containing protein [Ktedonobacterales bacterium]
GPHGVTIYEVKAWNGFYTASDDEWRFHPTGDARWEPAHGNPNQQALRHAQGMEQLLRQHKLKQSIVYPTIAVASERMHVEVAPPMSVSLIYLVSPRLTRNEILGTRSPASLGKIESEQIEQLLLERLPSHKRTITTAEYAPMLPASPQGVGRLRINPLRIALVGGAGVIALYILILVLINLFSALTHHL